MKKELEIKARQLRKRGYSINELHKQLKVSKSSISRWVETVPLSEKAKLRLKKRYTNGQIASQRSVKIKTKEKKIQALIFAENNSLGGILDKNIKILLCSLLYQCEGSKSIKDSIKFTNSDPLMVRMFTSLFRESFNIIENKLRVVMHLHSYHNEKIQKEYWSQITGIPKNQFIKTYNKKSIGLYKKEGYQGCIQIRYHNVEIARNIFSVAKIFMERYK